MAYMDPSTPRLTYDFDAEVARLQDLLENVNREQGRVALFNELKLAYYRGRTDALDEQRGRRHA